MIFVFFLMIRNLEVEESSWGRFLIISSDQLEMKESNDVVAKNLFTILKYVLINGACKILESIQEFYPSSAKHGDDISFLSVIEAKKIKKYILLLIGLIRGRFLTDFKARISHKKFVESLKLIFECNLSSLNSFLTNETQCFLDIVLFNSDWINEMIEYCSKMMTNNPLLQTKEFIHSVKAYKEYL